MWRHSLHEVIEMRDGLEDDATIPRRVFGQLPQEINGRLQLMRQRDQGVASSRVREASACRI